jgi:sec-independent protein translocase protein TatB
MFFDLGAGELFALAILAMILVGPERLPRLAADAAKIVKKVRKFTNSATSELRENLGPGFEDLQVADLNPKTFIRKQINDAIAEDDKASQSKPAFESKIDPDLI